MLIHRKARHERGFSLVELSIVILIMGLIIGGIAMPLSVQRENMRLNDAVKQLEQIEQAIIGFALSNGAIPCPATPASNGLALPAGGGCARQHGFVPASTLGLAGTRNDDNLLLDPWSSAVRYSITRADADADGNWDFSVAGEMSDVALPNLLPDLAVCSTAAGTSATACADPASTLTASAPFVIHSLGKDWGTSAGADQAANLGATVSGGPSGTSYRVAGDVVFVDRSRSAQAGNEFDDVIRFGSSMVLYQQMLNAGQLP